MVDILRKKLHIPRKLDHENGQDAKGSFEQMCKHAGIEPIMDQDDFPDEDVRYFEDPDEDFKAKVTILKQYPFGSWNFVSE